MVLLRFTFDLYKICYDTEQVLFMWFQNLFQVFRKFPPALWKAFDIDSEKKTL